MVDNFSKFGWTIPLKIENAQKQTLLKIFLQLQNENQLCLKLIGEKNFRTVFFKKSQITKTLNLILEIAH